MKQALIILLFLPIFSFGQSKTAHSLHLGAKAGLLTLPRFSFSGMQEGKPNIGYSVGWMGTYFFHERYFFRLGLGFENSRFLLKTACTASNPCFDFFSGSPITGLNYYETISAKSFFIPFDYGWRIRGEENDLKIFMGIGLQYNHIVKAKIKLRIEENGQEDMTQINRDGVVYASPISGRIFFGFEYPFSSKHTLIFEPMLKISPKDFETHFDWSYSVIEPGMVVRLRF